MIKYKANKIAEILNGKLNAAEDIEIIGVGNLENAQEGEVVCIFNPLKKNKKLPKASLFVISENESLNGLPSIYVKKPKNAFIKLLNLFNPNYFENETKISDTVIIKKNVTIGKNTNIENFVSIGENSKVGDNCNIYPNVFIGNNVEIGNNVIIKPNVSILDGIKIGNNVIIHANSTVGSDGFGYFDFNGKHEKIPQIGNVIIEDDVEIGSNVCIDRATIKSTIIKKGSKIDNLVQIGHNCIIGENCIIVSQVGISGSCKIGNNCIIAGQVGISDHIEIDDGTIILSKSGISKSIKGKNKIMWGIPAKEASEMRKIISSRNKLPKIIKLFNKFQNYIKENSLEENK